METEIEKGLKSKKVQNLVLEKILDQVDPDRREQPGKKETMRESNKY